MQACHQREREVLLLVTCSRQHFKFKRVPYFILLHTYTQDQDNYQDLPLIRIRIDHSVFSGIPPDISTVFEHTMGVAPVSVRIFLLCFLSSLSSQGSSAPIQSSVTGSLSPSLNGFVLVHG